MICPNIFSDISPTIAPSFTTIRYLTSIQPLRSSVSKWSNISLIQNMLCDLERRNRRYFALFHRIRWLSGTITWKWLKMRRYFHFGDGGVTVEGSAKYLNRSFKRSLRPNLLYTFGNSTHFTHPNFRWRGDLRAPVSQRWGPNCTKFWDDIQPSSMLPKFVLGIRYVASFQNWSASKSKIRPNFDIFDPL